MRRTVPGSAFLVLRSGSWFACTELTDSELRTRTPNSEPERRTQNPEPGTENAVSMMPSSVVISSRGEDRLRSGHPWIYRSDVTEAKAGPGDIVAVRSRRGQLLGS